MRKLISAFLLTGLLASTASAQSFFDTLKQKSREALENIEKVQKPDTHDTEKSPLSKEEKQQTGEPGHAIESASDLYGHWRGTVTPAGTTGYSMDAVGVETLITPKGGTIRGSYAANRCLGELKPTGTLGKYEAAFMDESESCGSHATLTFSGGMKLSIDWADMPGLKPGKHIYEGQLKLVNPPHERTWSAPADRRDELDIVGFKLGMSYEDALNLREAKHSDLEQEGAVATDLGTTSIISRLTEKGAKKLGSDVYGEQITLFFESQTPEEMDVKQRPEVLARQKKREDVLAKRAEMMDEYNKSLRSRRRGQPAPAPPTLPDVPDAPALRPRGADSELIIASRRLTFSNNRGPHQDNVIDAMTKKYGEPSIHVKELSSAGGRHLLAWVFDAKGDRIPDAEGGACDHMPKHLYNNKELAGTFSAGNMTWVFNTVTVSEKCGLTIRARMNVNGNGSVYQISTSVYDQQRLLGDQWHRAVELSEAMVADRKVKMKALKKRDVPDF